MRSYIYISDHRLDGLVGWATPGKGPVTGRSLTVAGTGSSKQWEPPDPRSVFHESVAVVEAYLVENGLLGEIDAPKDYFHGYLSMGWVAYNTVKPAVIYFTGETEHTVLALAGPLRYKVGLPGDDAKSREDANLMLHEPEVAAMINDTQTAAIADGEEEPEPGARRARERPRYRSWASDVLDVHGKLSKSAPQAAGGGPGPQGLPHSSRGRGRRDGRVAQCAARQA